MSSRAAGPCLIEGCGKPVLARGWCRTHYTRWYETGSTELGVRQPHRTSYSQSAPADRVLARISVTERGCWEYQGALSSNGYGVVQDATSGKRVMVHRAVWEKLRGPIPEGLQLDHLCRVRNCVNPDHLEPVTPAENTRRSTAGEKAAIRQRSKTHCPKGHPYDAENTYLYGGSRSCRTCGREYMRARRARLKEDSV